MEPTAAWLEEVILPVAWWLALVPVLGAITARRWTTPVARLARWSAVVTAVLAQLAFHLAVPPRNRIDGAARLLFLGPAAVVTLLAALAWAWRDRPRAPRRR